MSAFPELRLTRAALFTLYTSELRKDLCAVARRLSDEDAAPLLQTAALVLGLEILVEEDDDETLVRAEPSPPLALDDALVYAHDFATAPLHAEPDDVGLVGADLFNLPGTTLVVELGLLCRRLLSTATTLSHRRRSSGKRVWSGDPSATAGATASTTHRTASVLVTLKAAAFVRGLEALLATQQGDVFAQMGVLKAFTFAAGVCVDWMASSSSSSSPTKVRSTPRRSVHELVSMRRAIDVLIGLDTAHNDTKTNLHPSDADIETTRP